jgi:hypothetical protein
MQKIYILIFSLLFTTIAFAQKKLSNSKTGKNETEISVFILADNDINFGGEFIYRFAGKKNLKIGAGGLYGANYHDYFIEKKIFGYGAVFEDIIVLMGRRKRWGFGSQIGHGFYNADLGGAKLKAGIYYMVSANYRAKVSKKILISVSLFTGHRNFHYEHSPGFLPSNSGLIGLRAGVVF